MSDLVRKIRSNIAAAKGSEVKAITDNSSLRALWEDKQALLAEMNSAKRLAADEAAKPYLELIEELDQQYAVLLQFVGDNGESS